ncbi:MAG: hypothetical protein APF76_15325 [Desulfitibacter sp. BRH_c19]|nr:MAG: hypothetical protein APF76_15325 [Desulfitibacter sp. BRH_c19]
MKVVIVGGKLQGVEATYLAKKAGWEVILVDKKENAAATGMCDVFHRINIMNDQSETFAEIIRGKDLIIPALEDADAVKVIEKIAVKEDIPVAFDIKSNIISSSKLKSDKLFAKNNIPSPKYWPNCSVPVIAKPSGLSGSHGVRRFTDLRTLEEFINNNIQSKDEKWVIQEYLDGPSYSLEVMGYKGKYVTFQTTEIQVDSTYDCKRVLAPVNIGDNLEKQLHEITEKIASVLNLTGIMDVEVINQNGKLKVLEIDARLPSQTPITVYKSTGINMLTQLADIYVFGKLPVIKKSLNISHVIFEHISVSSQRIEILGEHIMANAGPLNLKEDFFGADEAVTNYRPGKEFWVATLIMTAEGYHEVWNKRAKVLKNIMDHLKISEHSDSCPTG